MDGIIITDSKMHNLKTQNIMYDKKNNIILENIDFSIEGNGSQYS